MKGAKVFLLIHDYLVVVYGIRLQIIDRNVMLILFQRILPGIREILILPHKQGPAGIHQRIWKGKGPVRHSRFHRCLQRQFSVILQLRCRRAQQHIFLELGKRNANIGQSGYRIILISTPRYPAVFGNPHHGNQQHCQQQHGDQHRLTLQLLQFSTETVSFFLLLLAY